MKAKGLSTGLGQRLCSCLCWLRRTSSGKFATWLHLLPTLSPFRLHPEIWIDLKEGTEHPEAANRRTDPNLMSPSYASTYKFLFLFLILPRPVPKISYKLECFPQCVSGWNVPMQMYLLAFITSQGFCEPA